MPWKRPNPDLQNDPTYLTPRINEIDVQLHEKAKREEIGVVSIEQFPIQAPETDDTGRIKRMLDNVGGKTNKIVFPKNTYYVSGSSIAVSLSNVIFEGNLSTITKTSGSGYIFSFSGNLNQKNIEMKNFILEGDNTALANGGLSFADNKDTSQITGLILHNIICRNFAQYGISIGSVSNFDIRNIRIENHGSITTGATIGVGFILYPKNAQSEGIIDGVYSEVNLNAKITSAAVKIQVAKHLKVSNIHAINGNESVFSLDSTDHSYYRNITIENRMNNGIQLSIGLVVSSKNDIIEIPVIDASSIVENVKFIGNFNNAFVLGNKGVVGCKFQKFDFSKVLPTLGARVSLSANSTVTKCVFKDFELESFRTDLYTGTQFNECVVDSLSLKGGAFTLIGNGNTVKNVVSKSGGVFKAVGDANTFTSCENYNSNTHSFQLEGNNNKLIRPISYNPPDTSRAVWVRSGDGNQVISLIYQGINGVLNNGTNTKELDTTQVL